MRIFGILGGFLFKKIYDFCIWFDGLALFTAIKRGFTATIPLFIVGAIPLILMYFPIPSIRVFIEDVWNGRLYMILSFINQATYGVATICVILAIAYKYAAIITHNNYRLSLISTIVAISSFFTTSSIRYSSLDGINVQIININMINVQSIFIGLIISLLSTRLFFILLKLGDKFIFTFMRSAVKKTREFDLALKSILPMLTTLLLFSVMSILLCDLTGKASVNEIIIYYFTRPFNYMGSTFKSGLLMVLFINILSIFGINGNNVLEAINSTIFTSETSAILSKSFFDTFVFMGGCGTLLCLLFAIFLFSRSKADRKLARRASIPMIFNINEIMLFGLPIVFNPVYLIPFLLTSFVCLTTSYFSVSLGIVTLSGVDVRWTTPVFFSGYQATNSWIGVLLQIVNLAIGVIIYAPFVKLSEAVVSKRYERDIKQMIKTLQKSEETGEHVSFLGKEGSIGLVAEDIAVAIREGISSNSIEMFYQPQIDKKGHVMGCEALLRYKAIGKNYIYPPLLLKIAKEDNTFDSLTNYIVEKVINDTKKINELFGDSIKVSLNIQANQFCDEKFMQDLVEQTRFADIIHKTLCIEITEESQFIHDEKTKKSFLLIKENGICVAIDDFSMGHTSITYLTNNSFDYVKLDGKLTKNILGNTRTDQIVKSICALGIKLNFEVIAEYVENEEQKELLKQHGCSIYQGWLYSPAIKFEEFIEYVKKINTPKPKLKKIIPDEIKEKAITTNL